MREKKFQSRIPFLLELGKKIPKKIAKKFKKFEKPLSGIIYSQKGMRQAQKERKKILVPNSVHTQPRKENSKKKQKKNAKKQLKNEKKIEKRPYFNTNWDKIG